MKEEEPYGVIDELRIDRSGGVGGVSVTGLNVRLLQRLQSMLVSRHLRGEKMGSILLILILLLLFLFLLPLLLRPPIYT